MLKRIIIITGIFTFIIGFGIITLLITMRKATSAYNEFDYSDLDLSEVADGTYIGSEDGKLVKAKVEVTIKDHTITNITILSHACGKGKPAETIVTDIITENSLSVDAISGATYSSDVIKVAVFNALN